MAYTRLVHTAAGRAVGRHALPPLPFMSRTLAAAPPGLWLWLRILLRPVRAPARSALPHQACGQVLHRHSRWGEGAWV